MTQPPDQPPQGGFGAPQDQPPPAGGFGAPQQPPAQGGFGAPPPLPPQPPYGSPVPPQQPHPGYGYPQQPGPYAQPGPYGPQPGYGYPQQPPYPGGPVTTPPPGSGAGGGGPFRGRPALVVAAAVAGLLVVGGTVYAVTGGGGGGKKPVARQSDDPKASGTPVNPGDGSGNGGKDPENLNTGRKPGEAKVLWYKSAPDAPANGADAPGMWITGKTAVKAAYKQVFAYNVGNGNPTWAPITFPQKICAVTAHKSADDKVVVAYMNGTSDQAKCNQLQEIDLNTGNKGWTATVADGGLFDSALSIALTISGKTLMVGRSESGTAYDLGSGDKLYDKKKYGTACFPTAFAGGTDRLIEVASCDAGGSDEHDEISQLDPATGRVEWTQPVKKGWQVQRTYSVDPLVVYMTNEDKKAWNISTLDGKGTFRSEVKVDEKFAPQCGWALLTRDLQGCQGVAADADTLYLPTDVSGGANEIVAISLADGRAKWRVKSPTDESMYPVKAEGGKLVAYVRPSYDAGGQVVSVPTAGASHETTRLLQNPQHTADIEDSFYDGAVDWVDGRFYVSSTRLTGSDQAKEKLMMAFGN
ncbi:putative pyrroloquinoline-quinone binding quinoprotein [Streptomyces sp. Ag109_O5-1]|uniref:PQQ-binding-like beta-propeller repeat protein n=1 Tax=Streptomyces sp. Ag109_O5-1 TaxID=1938851 RepID=UPI000F4D8013|nr:PQQ-binding-like beta-propeller repeat protein [Streptomyces sp. Ag109_O5-1]RPE43261.1 putative pyrroloquinoline-quinone binding quinoprotein [Streptomyces sp. Ag109_O5-1]